MFKKLFLPFVLAGALCARETGNIGLFEGASDVGEVAKKGTVAFDAKTGEYRLTGGGANIWGKHDDFFFLWSKLSGNIVLTATVRFEGDQGASHRKVALMIRQTLEPGSPQVNATVHYDGLTVLEYREATNDISRSVRFPVNGPTRIRLTRHDNWYTLYTAKPDQPLMEAGAIEVDMGGPNYVGLAVCPHDAQGEMTAVFSDVTLENPAPPAPRKRTKLQR
jgi:hypothetical protein